MANSEDLQFGTVSDILTVSSSWQSEHEAEDIEAEKVGVSVIGNDFIFVKGKKVRPLKKGNEKSIISFNIFTILEHENVELKETDSQHVGLGYKVLKENTWECPWKTVVKSRQGDRSNKGSKSNINSLKKFETKNPFGLLENISEENADGVLKRLKEIKSLKCRKYKGKSRKYKGRKRIKKEEFISQSMSQHYFKHSEEEEKLVNFKEEVKQNGKATQLKNKRCSKCFITHFPYPKFCRWAKSSERKVGILPDLTNELKTIIRKHIDRIERKEPRWEDFVIDAVSLNKESLSQFPDLVLENNRKLKGGAKEETIKQFTSKNNKNNTL